LEYAKRRKLVFLPVFMEPDVKHNEWLGTLLGATSFVEYSPSPINLMAEVVKRLDSLQIYPRDQFTKSEDSTDRPIGWWVGPQVHAFEQPVENSDQLESTDSLCDDLRADLWDSKPPDTHNPQTPSTEVLLCFALVFRPRPVF
jgi:hypothetical protein